MVIPVGLGPMGPRHEGYVTRIDTHARSVTAKAGDKGLVTS
jgi:hypothetical protein